MKLTDALKASHNHPPAAERTEILREQLARFRREFYAHLTDLQRFAAYEERHGELPSIQDATDHANAVVEDHGPQSAEGQAAANRLSLAVAKQRSEDALDTIDQSISATREELAKLDPDESPPAKKSR